MATTKGSKPFNSTPADIGVMPPQVDGGVELDSSDLVDLDRVTSGADRVAPVTVEPQIDLHHPGHVGEDSNLVLGTDQPSQPKFNKA